MARMTREDLEARVDDLEAENQMLQDKLDSISRSSRKTKKPTTMRTEMQNSHSWSGLGERSAKNHSERGSFIMKSASTY